MAKLRALFIRLLKALFITPIQDAFINLKSLSPGMRIVGSLGYLGLLAILLVMIASALWGANWSVESFNSLDTPVQVPTAVAAAALAGLLFSWAYLLTGATDCNPLIFLPLSLLFCGILAFLAISGSLMYAWACTLLPLVGAVSAAHIFTYKKPFWKKYPLLEFLFWSLAVLFAGLLTWLGSDKGAGLGDNVGTILSPFFLLLYPIWLLSGMSMVDLAVDLARWVVTQLHRLFPDPTLQALTGFVLVARLAIMPLMIVLNPGIVQLARKPDLDLQEVLLPAIMLMDGTFSYPLIIAGLVLAFRHRWNGFNCARLLTLCLVSPVFSLGMTFALGGRGDISNPLEMTINSLGVLPSVVVFVVMLTYGILGLGAKFARTDGRLIPRQGRILLVLGLAILVASLATYRVNLLETATLRPWNNFIEIFGNIFTISVVFLGVPYLVWVIWKRPQRLAGDKADFEAVRPRFTLLEQLPPRLWLVLALLAAIGMCILSYIAAFIVVWRAGPANISLPPF